MPAIYTRTGDKGDTGLFGGSRVTKHSLRVEAYGSVDEANASLGAAKAQLPDGEWRDRVHQIQHRIFVAGAELASDAKGADILDNKISTDDIAGLEQLIDDCLAITGPQRAFVVPGRDQRSAAFHVARTVVRRAERRTLTLADHEPVRPELIKYLNRLSDAVYALARLTEHWSDLARIESVVRKVVAAYTSGGSGTLAEPAESSRTMAEPAESSRTMAEPVEASSSQGSTLRQAQGSHSASTQTTAQGSHSASSLLSLDQAKAIAAAAEAKATQMGVPIVFAAVDTGGNPILLHRMADSLLASIDIAINKAWSSAAFKLPTSALGAAAAAGGPLPGLADGNQGRVVLFGGGIPVFRDGSIAGGLGVSGGTVEEDIEILTYAMTQVMGDIE